MSGRCVQVPILGDAPLRLAGQAPADVLETDEGAQQAADLLRRVCYGVLS